MNKSKSPDESSESSIWDARRAPKEEGSSNSQSTNSRETGSQQDRGGRKGECHSGGRGGYITVYRAMGNSSDSVIEWPSHEA